MEWNRQIKGGMDVRGWTTGILASIVFFDTSWELWEGCFAVLYLLYLNMEYSRNKEQ